MDAADLGLRVVPGSIDALTAAGAAITEVLRRDHSPTHPTDADLGFVYGTIIVDHEPATAPDGRATDATMRNVTVFADAEVDRIAVRVGDERAARLAVRRGPAGAWARTSATRASRARCSRVGSRSTTSLGEPRRRHHERGGHGYVTGYHTFVVDDRDPLGDGFLLR